MRLAALVGFVLALCAPAALAGPPPRPGWPYLRRPVCRTRYYGFFGTHHVIAAAGVADITPTCDALWAGLRGFPGCALLTKASCGGSDGYLQWRFQGWVSCNDGMIASAWYGATHNQFGALDCGGKQPEVQPEEEDDGMLSTWEALV